MEIINYVTPDIDITESSISIYGEEIPILKDMLKPYVSRIDQRHDVHNVVRVVARNLLSEENIGEDDIEIRLTSADYKILMEQMTPLSAKYLIGLMMFRNALSPSLIDPERFDDLREDLDDPNDPFASRLGLFDYRLEIAEQMAADFANPRDIVRYCFE